MEITYIKLKRIHEQQKLVAVADVTIDDLIVIHGIKVLSNRDKIINTPYDILVISGFSGSGKGTIINKLLSLHGRSISHIAFSIF